MAIAVWPVPIYQVEAPNRSQPDSEATRQRIQTGLDKYGCQPLVLDNAHGHIKSHSALFGPVYTQIGSAT